MKVTRVELEKVPAGVALADMTVPQLAVASEALARAGDLHANSCSICRLLEGVVLLEVKRKLGHGPFGTWVEANFSKSAQHARKRMQLAEAFIAALGDGRKLRLDARTRTDLRPFYEGKASKTNPWVRFDPARLLLTDLAQNLTDLVEVKLDMSHPVVKAAETYVAGRSYRQLLLDLPDGRGGDVTPRDEDDRRISAPRRTKATIDRTEFEQEAFQLCARASHVVKDMIELRGPKAERAWWPLHEETGDLAALELILHTAWQGVVEWRKRKRAFAGKAAR